jgi:excisionase family DNA binding protein
VLTVKAAAKRLGVSAALVYALCSARRLRHIRVGIRRGVLRIPEDALEEFQASCRVETSSDAKRPMQLKHLNL